MSVTLPNGATFQVASAYGSPVATTILTNASPCVVTATAHGYANGDFVELTSGWTRLNERVFKVANVTANTFELEGIDTSDTNVYPAGGGIGSVREITTWVQVTQITEFTSAGGEQQFFTYGFLEEQDDRQVPTTRNPYTLNITVADDPSQAYVATVRAADQSRTNIAGRLNLVNGDQIAYNGILTFTQTPNTTRNQIMTIPMTYSLSNLPNRYS